MLDSPIPPEEQVVEKDGDFWDGVGTSDSQSTKKVIKTVVPNFANGDLSTCNNDRFPKAFQKEGKCRSGIAESIGSVQDEKSIEILVVILDI